MFAAVRGYQTAGPYEGETGWWIVSVPARRGRVQTVTFIPEVVDQGSSARVTSDGSAAVLTGESIHRVELESGKVTSWTIATAPDTDLRSVVKSPGAAAVAWDTWSSSDALAGYGVYVLDTRTGARVSITPPPDLASHCYGLSGWSPDGDLLAVMFARPKDVLDEGFFPPSGLETLVFFDSHGVERQRVAPAREGWTIGVYAWSPDGMSLLYTQGTVEIVGSGPKGLQWFGHNGRELWIWSKHTGRCQRLIDTRRAKSVEWQTNSVVSVQGGGLLVLKLTREDDTWAARPVENSYFSTICEHEGFVYGFRTEYSSYQVLVVKDGTETLVYEGSSDYPYWFLSCVYGNPWFGAKHLSFVSTQREQADTYLVVVPIP